MALRRPTFLPLLVSLSLAACGGDSGTGPDDGNGGNGGGGGGPAVKADPSFADDIQPIFTRNGCTDSQCHGEAQQAGLDLRAGSSYAALVNRASTQTGTLRVIPGNANGSYVIMKLEGRAPVGERMPLGGSAIGATDLTNLKNWINQGAKNN